MSRSIRSSVSMRDTARLRHRRSSCCNRSAASSRPGQPGKVFNQSNSASVPARAGTARNKAITCAAARVVDSAQPVSSANGTRWRSSRARTRRTSCRSCPISAIGTSPRSRCTNTWAAAHCASCSKPPQRARRGSSETTTCIDGAASASMTRQGTPNGAACISDCTSGSGPPACRAIQAAGRASNRRSVDGAELCAAHSSATRASQRCWLPGPVAGESNSRADAQYASRSAGATEKAACASSCAVCVSAATARSKRRGSLRAHAMDAPCERISRAALRRSAATSKASCIACRDAPGPSEAASVCVVSIRGCQPPMCPNAWRASGSS